MAFGFLFIQLIDIALNSVDFALFAIILLSKEVKLVKSNYYDAFNCRFLRGLFYLTTFLSSFFDSPQSRLLLKSSAESNTPLFKLYPTLKIQEKLGCPQM